MLTHDKEALLDIFKNALRATGWQLIFLNDEHPVRVRLARDHDHIDAWVHIWNLSSGGRSTSRPFERRVQVTNIGDRFRATRGVRTLILGWSAETNVFAAFDYKYHSGHIGSSASLQTDLMALEAAVRDGIGVYAKKTGELSIAVRPEMLGIYLEEMDALHSSGVDDATLEALRQMAASPLDISPEDIPSTRRRVMAKTLKLLRDHRFSRNVLEAYGHRCAFCEIQLRLLDAAHILPVGHPESTDEVTNGVALCALHHRSYDSGLATFDEDFTIKISRTLTANLSAEGKHGGMEAFRSALRPTLYLPQTMKSWPSTSMVSKANALRGWT